MNPELEEYLELNGIEWFAFNPATYQGEIKLRGQKESLHIDLRSGGWANDDP